MQGRYAINVRNMTSKLKGRGFCWGAALLLFASLLAASYNRAIAAPFQMVCRYTGAPMPAAQPLAARATRACYRSRSHAAAHLANPGDAAFSTPPCCDLRQSPDRADTQALAPDAPQAPVFAHLIALPSVAFSVWTNAPARRYFFAEDRGNAPPLVATYAPRRGPPHFS